MVARRGSKRTRRAPRVIGINLIELGTGLAIASAADAPAVLANVQKADFGGALKTLQAAFTNKDNQAKMVAAATGAVLAKGLAKSLRVRRIGKLGPLSLNI